MSMSHLYLFSPKAVLYPFHSGCGSVLNDINEQASIIISCDIATQSTHKSSIILLGVFQTYIAKTVNSLDVKNIQTKNVFIMLKRKLSV